MTVLQKRGRQHILLLCALLALLFSACTNIDASQNQNGKNSTSSLSGAGSISSQPMTYSNKAQDVVLRTFYGGGIYGALEVNPDISLYGDGTYIFGADRQGKLDDAGLQGLLHTLTDTYGLLNFKRQQFSDIQDQNATFLEITLNGKQQEFMYGSFGNQQESSQDMDEYHRLDRVLTTITETLKGPTHPYKGSSTALLVHQTFGPDQPALSWPLSDYTLAQAYAFECGLLPKDETSHNWEVGCLKYLIPHDVILLNTAQVQAISGQLPTQQRGPLLQGLFSEGSFYYTVTLRPLLPDELPRKSVAMFGSAQSSFTNVPLLNGQVPPVPTPTPST
ncbi:MAG: hypothetical protein NVSMB49_15770 [Ktedonobacteraceae bacterium]